MTKFTQWLESIIQFYDNHIKKPFIAFRNVVLHLWVPIFCALLSFVLFAKVPQTQDIYRSLTEEIAVSGFKIFIGTFLVFLLSVLVWFSGRLLSYRYSEDEKVTAETQTNFQAWSKQSHHSSPFAFLEIVGDFLRSDTDGKASLAENLSLLYIPRVIGLIPFAGLIFGLQALKNPEPVLMVWLAICWLAEGALFALFWLRRNLLKTQSISNRPGLDDSLFSPEAENLLANLGLFCFGALSLPIVASQSGKGAWGVIAFFLICVAMNVSLVLWNPIDKPLWQKKNIFNPVLLGILVFISGLIFLNVSPTFWPDRLGSVSIAAISLCIVVVILSTIYNWGNEFGIPAVSGIVVLAIFSSLVGWNNNHQIRLPQIETPAIVVPDQDIASAFQDWFSRRPDLDSFKGKEYPVYIVSAQGGGIYAAYHAATTLAKLHDAIPNFDHHVFAISGVSGGAVGSSVYGALAKEFGQGDSSRPCAKLADCAQAILGEDFLSPQFALALFPDLLQRFLPFPVNDWDRARGLDVAMEESWKTHISNADEFEAPLSKPFYQYWDADGQSPALVLNTTNVETGQRLLLSPFLMKNTQTLADFETSTQSLALSTAAGLSARFPVISSAGWFKHTLKDKTYRVRLIDGGYVDNSGLATTRDIMAALEQKQGDDQMSAMDKIQESSSKEKPKPRLISLAIVGLPIQRELSTEAFQGLNEIGSPLLGFWNVYNNRSDQVIEQARFDFNRNAIQSGSQKIMDYGFRGMYLDPSGLPLGWLLSDSSQDRIDAQVPPFDNEPCKNKSEAEIVAAIANPITSKEARLTNNACVAKSIELELSGQLTATSE